jgi:hypothetical protein
MEALHAESELLEKFRVEFNEKIAEIEADIDNERFDKETEVKLFDLGVFIE